MDPHHFNNLDLHPDPHPHHLKVKDPHPHKIYQLDPEPDPHQFA
jgi:hypothetical protein